MWSRCRSHPTNSELSIIGIGRDVIVDLGSRDVERLLYEDSATCDASWAAGGRPRPQPTGAPSTSGRSTRISAGSQTSSIRAIGSATRDPKCGEASPRANARSTASTLARPWRRFSAADVGPSGRTPIDGDHELADRDMRRCPLEADGLTPETGAR